MTAFVQLLVNGAVSGSIVALAAISISRVHRILRIVDFAHGDYLAFAA